MKRPKPDKPEQVRRLIRRVHRGMLSVERATQYIVKLYEDPFVGAKPMDAETLAEFSKDAPEMPEVTD